MRYVIISFPQTKSLQNAFGPKLFRIPKGQDRSCRSFSSVSWLLILQFWNRHKILLTSVSYYFTDLCHGKWSESTSWAESRRAPSILNDQYMKQTAASPTCYMKHLKVNRVIPKETFTYFSSFICPIHALFRKHFDNLQGTSYAQRGLMVVGSYIQH